MSTYEDLKQDARQVSYEQRLESMGIKICEGCNKQRYEDEIVRVGKVDLCKKCVKDFLGEREE